MGPQGLPEFFTFVRRPKSGLRPVPGQPPEIITVETIRVHAALFDINSGKKNLIFSHTIHEDNLEKIIRAALEGIYQIHNLMLEPISVRKRSRRSNIEKKSKDAQLILDLLQDPNRDGKTKIETEDSIIEIIEEDGDIE